MSGVTEPKLNGWEIMERVLSPEMVIYENSSRLQNWSVENPTASRLLFGFGAAFTGFAKPLVVFPIACAVSSVALPVIGLISLLVGKGNPRGCFEAGGIALLGALCFVTFAVATAYYIPLPYASLVAMVAIAISIGYHVHRALKIPPELAKTLPTGAALAGALP